MANKRRLEKKRILEKNKDRLVVYHSTKNNTESIVSESSRGESFISEEKKIVHEENMILPPVPQEEPQTSIMDEMRQISTNSVYSV